MADLKITKSADITKTLLPALEVQSMADMLLAATAIGISVVNIVDGNLVIDDNGSLVVVKPDSTGTLKVVYYSATKTFPLVPEEEATEFPAADLQKLQYLYDDELTSLDQTDQDLIAAAETTQKEEDALNQAKDKLLTLLGRWVYRGTVTEVSGHIILDLPANAATLQSDWKDFVDSLGIL